MKNLWSEILVPAVIAGLTVIGTVGVESARTVRPETRVRLLREVRLEELGEGPDSPLLRNVNLPADYEKLRLELGE